MTYVITKEQVGKECFSVEIDKLDCLFNDDPTKTEFYCDFDDAIIYEKKENKIYQITEESDTMRHYIELSLRDFDVLLRDFFGVKPI
jgi:hypothetical protein